MVNFVFTRLRVTAGIAFLPNIVINNEKSYVYVSVAFEIGRRPFFPIDNLQKSPQSLQFIFVSFVALDSAAGAFSD